MNHSIYTADRATHLKVVVSVLIVGIAAMAAALNARPSHLEIDAKMAAPQTVYKARADHALTEMARFAQNPI